MRGKKKMTGAVRLGMGLVSAGLVSTWDTARATDLSFTGSITPTNTLDDVYFVISVGACQGGGTFSKEIAASVPANVTTDFSFTVTNIPVDVHVVGEPTNFTIAAVYDVPNGGVSIAYNSDVAARLFADGSPEWGDSPFIPADYGGGVFYQFIGGSESIVSSELLSGSFDSPLTAGYPDISPPLSAGVVSNFTLVDFSGASPGGVGTLQQVPLPAPVAIAMAGFAGVVALRWRRKNTA